MSNLRCFIPTQKYNNIGHIAKDPLGAHLVKNPPAMQETWVQSLGWEDPLEKGKATHSSILAWRIACKYTVHGVTKSQMWLSNFHFHFFHFHMSVYVCVCSVTQSRPTLCDPMNCSLPGSSVHGILQEKILEWVAMPFSGGSSQPRDQNCIF